MPVDCVNWRDLTYFCTKCRKTGSLKNIADPIDFPEDDMKSTEKAIDTAGRLKPVYSRNFPYQDMWWKLKEYLTEHVRGEEVSLNKDFEETFRHVLAEMAMLETQYLQ